MSTAPLSARNARSVDITPKLVFEAAEVASRRLIPCTLMPPS